MGGIMRSSALLLIVLLIVPIVISLPPLDIDIQSGKSNIFHNEVADYTLTVRNPYNYPILIYLSFPNIEWVGYTEPLSDYTFSLEPGEMKSVRILLSPKPSVSVGPYSVKIRVKERTNDRIYDVGLPVYIKSDRPITSQFLPSIRVKLESKYNIDPREPWDVNVSLENLNPKNITNLSVRLYSELFDDSFLVSISGNDDKVVKRTYNLDKFQKPMDGLIRLHAIYKDGNKTFQWEDAQYFKVISYHDIKKDISYEKSFLQYKTIYRIRNDGNVEDEVRIEVPMTNFEMLFTTYDKEPDILNSRDGKYYVWSYSIPSQESTEFSYTTDYRPLFYLIVIILIILLLYYVLRSPIIVVKDVAKLATKEGGISNIKIIIQIKNRTNRSYEDIKIMDKIPHLVDIEKDFEIGTIEPVSVAKNTKTGTLVKWEFSHLDPYEERIITYKIKSQMSILGGLSLPPVVIKFHDKKGREMIVKSNRLNLEI